MPTKSNPRDIILCISLGLITLMSGAQPTLPGKLQVSMLGNSLPGFSSNGEYLVLLEEDSCGKNLLSRWMPGS